MENLTFNLQILLDAIGLVQGVTIGILLMFMGLRKFRNSFYLGLFLFLYALELGTWISVNTKIAVVYPQFYLLPFNFSWILFPLFYIYTQQVSVFSGKKVRYWLLFPGVLTIIAQVFIFLLPYETKQVIKDSFWHVFIFWMLGNFFSWTVGIWNLRLLYRHKFEVLNTYSYIAHKELTWARYFLIYLLATSVFGHLVAYVFVDAIKDNTIFSIMDLIAIYWVSYYGITQRNVRSLFANAQNPTTPEDTVTPKDRPSEEIPERLEELMSTIDGFIRRTECFINPELTIMDLAEGIKEHPKRVSEAINTVGRQNFNSCINIYRIEKAKSLLRSDQGTHLSIDGISLEVGFKSKSAFYAAFKKFTGTTPTHFKETVPR